MDWFSVIVGMVSILSLLLDVLTLIFTMSTKRALLRQRDKIYFMNEISTLLKDLLSFDEVLTKDMSLYNESLLRGIDDKLDDVLVSYANYIDRSLSKDIINLRNLITNKYILQPDNKQMRQECHSKLHHICGCLKKAKRSE